MSVYLERYAYPPLLIKERPNRNTGMIVVIPVFNEKNLLKTLISLSQSSLPSVITEVLIIINQPDDSSFHIISQNKKTLKEVNSWILKNYKEGLIFYVKHISIAKKNAGVGLARKAGMDEAVRRFEEIGNEKGIILCLDADCTCQQNYLKEVYHNFYHHKLKGASIYYQHETEGLSEWEKEGILQYELHLRYYINSLRKAGYPYAFHTVGSCMAVRVDIYRKSGGMNKRKAGEDFHFLHKIIPYGNFEEINTTTVFPSPRVSTRVPFGTGKAMGDWIKQRKNIFYTYHPQIFYEIEVFLKQSIFFYRSSKINENLKKIDGTIKAYLERENISEVLKEINQQSSNLSTFIHRWFSWLNGLRILHLVHYLRDNKYSSIPISEIDFQEINARSRKTEEILETYRKLDKLFISNQIDWKRQYCEHR